LFYSKGCLAVNGTDSEAFKTRGEPTLIVVPALFLEGIFMGNVGSMGLMGDMVTVFLVIF
jgi:hypothetical protein